MKVKDLAKFQLNPRKISPSQQRILYKGLDKYGDLSGVVWNKIKKELVGGNQRTDAFNEQDEIVYTEKHKKPDDQGTVALGYIVHQGKKYSYREVAWGEEDHLAASLLANKGGGEWDWAKVKEIMTTLDTGAFDMEYTGFDTTEMENMMASAPLPSTSLDYSALDGESVDSQVRIMAEGVRKAIQIEFLPADYERVQILVKHFREKGAYIGIFLIEDLERRLNDSGEKLE